MSNETPLPDNYEIYFSQVSGLHSIWYTESSGAKPELMVGGFETRDEAMMYLLCL